jgi:DNA-binding transcriptional MerR regulator
MKMRDLSDQSGVPVATIKYYIREGLLDPGHHRGANQADYGESHVQRLALIRALREVGGLSVATIGKVLQVAAAQGTGIVAGMGLAIDALAEDDLSHIPPDREGEVTELAARFHAVLQREGWTVRSNAAALRVLARASLAAQAVLDDPIECEADVEEILDYARPAMEIARAEFSSDEPTIFAAGESAIAGAVAGTLLFEPMILALRRLAHEHLMLQRLPEAARQAVLADPISLGSVQGAAGYAFGGSTLNAQQ